MNELLKVVIIDNGINLYYFRNTNVKIVNYSIINNQLKKYYFYENSNEINHGTICSLIISSMNRDIMLIGIDVFNKKRECNSKNILVALDWCYKHSIDFINMSIGSTSLLFEDEMKFRRICLLLHIQGKILISAFSNDNRYSSPARYDCVVGVKSGKFNRIKYNDNSAINFISTSKIHLKIDENVNIVTDHCNSYAAAYITNQLIRFKNKSCSIKYIPIFHSYFKKQQYLKMSYMRPINYMEISENKHLIIYQKNDEILIMYFLFWHKFFKRKKGEFIQCSSIKDTISHYNESIQEGKSPLLISEDRFVKLINADKHLDCLKLLSFLKNYYNTVVIISSDSKLKFFDF